MRILSVRQPWASLLADGRKTVESRSWPTRYRGPVLIAASRARSDLASARQYADGPRGCIVGVVDLIDVIDVQARDRDRIAALACLDPGELARFAWMLAEPRAFSGPTWSGQLGLAQAPKSLLATLEIDA